MENSEAVPPKARKSKTKSKLSPSHYPRPGENPGEKKSLAVPQTSPGSGNPLPSEESGLIQPKVLSEPEKPLLEPQNAENWHLTEVQQSASERGQRDLYFFCHDILGYRDMLPRVHQQVCDVYGPSDPKKPFEDQDTIHNYLILDPRGEFKTSISIGKTLQNWVNFPNITTLRMSGIETLVKRTIHETKLHLLTNSILRELYPEAVPWSDKKNEQGLAPSDFGTAYGLVHPKRTLPRREPTLTISTLDSVKAGSHYEWVCGDDLVHEKNYQTRDLLQKTHDDWNLAHNLLNPGGVRELDGTRYDWSDLYGTTMETNTGGHWRVHSRPIWTSDFEYGAQNGFVMDVVYTHPITGERLVLLHPERWSFEKLLEIQNENPYLFNCQRLNNPVPPSSDNFPMEQLIKHTVKREKYPDTGMMNVFMMWHFNFSDPEAEPAVGVVGGWDARGRLFVIDLVTGYFKPSQLIDLMVSFWMKWPVSRVGFEDNKKQRMIEPGLMSRLKTLKLSFAIDWIKFGGSQQTDDDMINRVMALEPLLRENQLWFHGELPHLTNLYLQFSRFPKFRLRGIPYAISRLMHYRSQTQTMGNLAVYGMELYSPALSWNKEDQELGAGLTG